MKNFQLTVVPAPTTRMAHVILRQGDDVLVDINSADWILVATMLLLGIGFDRLTLVTDTGDRSLTEQTVRTAMRNHPNSVFKPMPASMGAVVLTHRYSDALEEFRMDVTVNDKRLDGSLPASFSWQVLHGLLVMLSK